MTATSMVRAAYVRELGPAENIRVGPLPLGEGRADEVLVRVDGAAVNHVDTFVRAGAYPTPVTLPFVIGRDLVGTVAAAAGGFARGERVWCNSMGYDGRQGACADLVRVPAGRLYRLPEGVDATAALGVLHPGATAHLGLHRDARLNPDHTVAVNGSGGAVGSAVVQIAAAAGARVIAIDRAANGAWARRCGAAVILDRDEGDTVSRLAALTCSGIDVFWDTTGRLDLRSILPLMALGGQVTIVAGLQATTVLPLGPLYTRDAVVRGFAISNAGDDDLREAARGVNDLLARNLLHARDIKEFALEDAAAAHRAQERRTHPCSRLVLTT